jgi:hypothetical protein
MADQIGFSDILSKHVMEDIKRKGIDLRPPEDKIDFPLIGEKFLIERNECEIIYINIGKVRFTCKYSAESDFPPLGKTFMFKGYEYKVTHSDLKKKKFTFEPYGGKGDSRNTEATQGTE